MIQEARVDPATMLTEKKIGVLVQLSSSHDIVYYSMPCWDIPFLSSSKSVLESHFSCIRDSKNIILFFQYKCLLAIRTQAEDSKAWSASYWQSWWSQQVLCGLDWSPYSIYFQGSQNSCSVKAMAKALSKWKKNVTGGKNAIELR